MINSSNDLASVIFSFNLFSIPSSTVKYLLKSVSVNILYLIKGNKSSKDIFSISFMVFLGT